MQVDFSIPWPISILVFAKLGQKNPKKKFFFQKTPSPRQVVWRAAKGRRPLQHGLYLMMIVFTYISDILGQVRSLSMVAIDTLQRLLGFAMEDPLDRVVA